MRARLGTATAARAAFRSPRCSCSARSAPSCSLPTTTLRAVRSSCWSRSRSSGRCMEGRRSSSASSRDARARAGPRCCSSPPPSACCNPASSTSPCSVTVTATYRDGRSCCAPHTSPRSGSAATWRRTSSSATSSTAFCAPIALAEAMRPSMAHRPWFGWRGLAIVAALWVAVAGLILGDDLANEPSHATAAEVMGTLVVTAAFVFAAFRVGRKSGVARGLAGATVTGRRSGRLRGALGGDHARASDVVRAPSRGCARPARRPGAPFGRCVVARASPLAGVLKALVSTESARRSGSSCSRAAT